MEQKIYKMVERYSNAIHTQKAEDFLPLWNENTLCTLISPSGYYVGIESIYQDFLLEQIRKAYSRIDLIADNVDIRIINDTSAVVIFSYYTDCNRRDTGEPFGIAGLETQVYHKVGDNWKLTHVHYSLNPKE